MKLIRSEFGHDYASYRFGYCEYAEYEEGDNLADIYAQGFLPYSADPAIHNRFYLARSARVNLHSFECTSENRRITKRFDGLFTTKLLTLAEYSTDTRVSQLFLSYFTERHGEHVMDAQRLGGILSTSLPLRVMTYEQDGALCAAVLEVATGTARHFWFSAYDPAYARQSLGMWLMIDGARRAKHEGAEHYYVGTAYGAKALYKTNLEPLEFWDGTKWNADSAELKRLARTD